MTPKKLILSALVAVSASLVMEAGAPPTVMFLPDLTWCKANNFVSTSERQGKTRYSEKFDEAFMDSPALKDVVVQLNGLMNDNGIQAKDYATASQLDDEEEDELELYEGEDGGTADLTPYEMALQKLRPDIIITVGWEQNKVGFNYTLSYRLEAKDSYTGKSIAQVTGSTPTLKTTIPVQEALKSAATEHMPQFISRLQNYFDDLQENGREVTLLCRIGSNSGANMNSEVGGKELSTLITDWVNDNTVNHAYSTRNSSRNSISFEQVRIPFTDSNGRRMQAKEFTDQLKRYLNGYGITAENSTKGLGSGRLLNITK